MVSGEAVITPLRGAGLYRRGRIEHAWIFERAGDLFELEVDLASGEAGERVGLLRGRASDVESNRSGRFRDARPSSSRCVTTVMLLAELEGAVSVRRRRVREGQSSRLSHGHVRLIRAGLDRGDGVRDGWSLRRERQSREGGECRADR